MKIINYLRAINGWLYVILFFCIVGFFRNIMQLSYFGFNYSNVATKVFVAMIVIYFAQIILILLRERKAWIISIMQVFFCVYVYEDFTFVPLTNFIKMAVFHFFPNMDYSWHYFMNTAVVSLLFSLGLLKTYLIYVFTEPLPIKKKSAKAEQQAA